MTEIWYGVACGVLVYPGRVKDMDMECYAYDESVAESAARLLNYQTQEQIHSAYKLDPDEPDHKEILDRIENGELDGHLLDPDMPYTIDQASADFEDLYKKPDAFSPTDSAETVAKKLNAFVKEAVDMFALVAQTDIQVWDVFCGLDSIQEWLPESQNRLTDMQQNQWNELNECGDGDSYVYAAPDGVVVLSDSRGNIDPLTAYNYWVKDWKDVAEYLAAPSSPDEM